MLELQNANTNFIKRTKFKHTIKVGSYVKVGNMFERFWVKVISKQGYRYLTKTINNLKTKMPKILDISVAEVYDVIN